MYSVYYIPYEYRPSSTPRFLIAFQTGSRFSPEFGFFIFDVSESCEKLCCTPCCLIRLSRFVVGKAYRIKKKLNNTFQLLKRPWKLKSPLEQVLFNWLREYCCTEIIIPNFTRTVNLENSDICLNPKVEGEEVASCQETFQLGAMVLIAPFTSLWRVILRCPNITSPSRMDMFPRWGLVSGSGLPCFVERSVFLAKA